MATVRTCFPCCQCTLDTRDVGAGVIDRDEFINGYGKYNDVIRSQHNKDMCGGTLQLSSPAPVQAKSKDKKKTKGKSSKIR